MEPHRLAVRHQHAGGETPEHRLVDVERLALDGAGHPQFRADHLLTGRHAVLDEERLCLIGGPHVEEGQPPGERRDGPALLLGRDQDVRDPPRAGCGTRPASHRRLR